MKMRKIEQKELKARVGCRRDYILSSPFLHFPTVHHFLLYILYDMVSQLLYTFLIVCRWFIHCAILSPGGDIMQRWLKGFAKASLGLAEALGLLGIITLTASLIFTIKNTGEPILWLGITLALFSVALGCLSVALSDKADERMQAMADLEFDEKLVILYTYSQVLDTRKEMAKDVLYNVRAGLRISKWASPEVKSEFRSEFEKVISSAKKIGDEELAKSLKVLSQQYGIDTW